MRVLILFLTAGFGLSSGAPIVADSRTITSGLFVARPSIGLGGPWNFYGDGFHLQGSLQSGSSAGGALCTGCLPGTVIRPNFSIIGNDISGGGSGMFDNQSYASTVVGSLNARWPTQFDVVASSVLVTGPGVYRGTFDFSGTMCIYTEAPFGPRDCDIRILSLTGAGTYEATITEASGLLWDFVPTQYTFGVPEPASWWTSGAALLLLASATGRIRLRRR
jgi:hypothetical protein